MGCGIFVRIDGWSLDRSDVLMIELEGGKARNGKIQSKN